MAESQVRRLPVVDVDGRLVGVVSLADVARHLAEMDPVLVATTVGEISEPASVHV
jgi:CBS domain-containing protein